MVAAIIACGATFFMTGCKTAKTINENTVQKVSSEELIRTSQSWDGVELPDYFQGSPELVAVKYIFPAGKKLGWHHHPVINLHFKKMLSLFKVFSYFRKFLRPYNFR